jgi:hypothetical protein
MKLLPGPLLGKNKLNVTPENKLRLKMDVFWNVALRSLVAVYRRFGGTYCLHHQEYFPKESSTYLPP